MVMLLACLAIGILLWFGVALVVDSHVLRQTTSPAASLVFWYRSRRLVSEAEMWLNAQAAVDGR